MELACLEPLLSTDTLFSEATQEKSVSAVPNLFGTGDGFHGRQSFHGPGLWRGERGDGFRMIQVLYFYWALYFYSNVAANLAPVVPACDLEVGDLWSISSSPPPYYNYSCFGFLLWLKQITTNLVA